MATDVTAHIAGTVWKIEKKPGDSVSEGEPVLILECMKMEVPVESPAGGRLAQMRVAEGDEVEEGQVIATLE